MTYPICSTDNQSYFEKNGYLHVKNFFTPDSCLSICKALESLDPSRVKDVYSSRSTYINESNSFELQYSGLTYLQKASIFIPEICAIKSLPLLQFSAQLLGITDAFYLEDEVHVRQPFSSHEIPAHQDNFYFALQNPKALTCYVYLTNQERTSGALGFLPSSISLPTDDHQPSQTVGFSSYNKSIEINRKEEFYYPSTSSGDVIFHHSNTYHRAFSNMTSTTTLSLSIRVFSCSNLLKSQEIHGKYSSNLNSNRS